VRPSSTSRFLALSIAAAGILTFFGPLVTVDPPVAGTTRWSAFSIVLQMYNGVLPSPICERCGEPVIRTFLALPLWVTAEYFLILAALVILCLRMPANAIKSMAIGGVISCYEGWYWRDFGAWNFEETFFGSSGHGHIHYGGLLATHLVVMGVLFMACLDLRDDESLEKAQERSQRSRLLVESHEPPVNPEPPFIDAEIVRENEGSGDTPHTPRRLHD
jgi:hypothetical protein